MFLIHLLSKHFSFIFSLLLYVHFGLIRKMTQKDENTDLLHLVGLQSKKKIKKKINE